MWGQHRNRPQYWSRKDVALAEALILHEDGLCRGCGMPSRFAYDPFNAGEFELLSDVTCLACEQREMDEEKHGPGEKPYIKNHLGT